MPTESATLSLLSIISLITFFVFLLINKFLKEIGEISFLDKDFDKPQAFHKESIARTGGLASIVSLLFFFYFVLFIVSKNFN